MLNTPGRVQNINDKVATITKASVNRKGELTGFDVSIEKRDISLAVILLFISMIGIILSFFLDSFVFFVLFWALFYSTSRVLRNYFDTTPIF